MPLITHPTALSDQLQAAETHLTRILDRAAPSVGMTTDTGPVGPWLAERIEQFAEQADTGALVGCTHLDHGPAAAFAALSAPGLLVCHQCTARLVGDPDTEMQCDRCGHLADEFDLTAVSLGAIALLVVLCGPCSDQDQTNH